MICKNSLKWSTVINFSCSLKSNLIHETTNRDLCIHVFNWKSPKACETLVVDRIIIYTKNETYCLLFVFLV